MGNGIVIYDGPSRVDKKPIVGIVTGTKVPSNNPKTGFMHQLWILVKDMHPLDAVETGADVSICGDCSMRGGACYVRVSQAPSQVRKSYLSGNYPLREPTDPVLKLRPMRFGAYGDPAALPNWVLRALRDTVPMHTGYTHLWRRFNSKVLRSICMASVESVVERREAIELGFRTFRVRKTSDLQVDNELVCPASEEAGKITTCSECLLCNGDALGVSRPDVVINVHGSRSSLFHGI